jgi:hypothetical protein
LLYQKVAVDGPAWVGRAETLWGRTQAGSDDHDPALAITDQAMAMRSS